MAGNRKITAQYKANRAALMEGHPDCYWCGKPWDKSFQADHLLEHDAGGDDSSANLVSSCPKCNASRGATYVNRKTAARQQARNEALNKPPKITENSIFLDEVITPSKHLQSVSPKAELARTGENQQDYSRIGRTEPRLETIRKGNSVYADLVKEFASKYMQVELMDWQLYALDGLFEADPETGDLVNRAGLISVARQCGKTVLGQAVLGAWMTSIAALRGKPQTVVNSAHELTLAVRQFEVVAPILAEYFGATLKRAYGRNSCEMPDGSRWLVKAATPSAGMGLSCDLIWVDEIYAVDDNVLAHSLRPTMKARNVRTAGGSPIMMMTSTAGTEASIAMLRYREQGLQLIDEKRQGSFYFAEWSPPPGVDVMDTKWWGWANPALGQTLELESLLLDADHPDRSSFLRGSLNQFVNADACWLQPGQWDACLSDIEGPEGGWIAVDSSLDGSRYVAVRAAVDDVGVAHVKVEFVVQSLAEMQEALLKSCENPQVMLAVTPTLEHHVPLVLKRRSKVVGYGELMKYTSLVKGMINDGRIVHMGQSNLAEHMNRAVAISQQNALALSSKRSPGPIELARCTIWAAALASRPKQGGKPMLVVVNR
jgi:phage terminase large subunit-like protein